MQIFPPWQPKLWKIHSCLCFPPFFITASDYLMNTFNIIGKLGTIVIVMLLNQLNDYRNVKCKLRECLLSFKLLLKGKV